MHFKIKNKNKGRLLLVNSLLISKIIYTISIYVKIQIIMTNDFQYPSLIQLWKLTRLRQLRNSNYQMNTRT